MPALIGATGGGNAAKTRPARPPATVYAPFVSPQLYTFVGSLTNVAEVATFSFQVLAGDGPPNITAGFVKLNVIDRPQRKGFTIPAGYDPISVDIPVQFESWINQPAGQHAITSNVDYDIQQLEWMAGRGKLFASKPDHGVGAPATGDPPLVTVASFDAGGNETNLVPPNLHGVLWIVSNIAYDGDNTILGVSGNRRRVPAVVSLTEYVASAGTTLDSPTTRAKARNALTATNRTYLSTGALNTVSAIVDHYIPNATAQDKQTVRTTTNSKLGVNIRSVLDKLPVGTKVIIPASLQVAQGA